MLDLPLHRFMTTPVESIEATATLSHACERMTHRRISALPVLDRRGRATGVITRSDLLRAGRQAGTGEATLSFGDRQVADAVTRRVLTLSIDATVADAARYFLDAHIHRVFIEEDGRIIGVSSGRDLMSAVAVRGLAMPISTIMSSPLHSIHARTTLGEAVDELLRDGVSTLVVHEADRPVGVFSRHEALSFAAQPARTAVGELMRLGALTLAASTPAGDAAARAIEENVRQILVEDDGSLRRTDPPASHRPRPLGGILGIVTSTDFAGAALMNGVGARSA